MYPTVYGIPNCDTVKKARTWLADHAVAHDFHDFRKAGVPEDRVAAWVQAVGADKLLNRQGTTWRKLGPELQAAAEYSTGARAVMLQYPAVMRRPVVEWPDGVITVGFDAGEWALRARL